MNCTNYFDKKVNIQEAICEMEVKINEMVNSVNKIETDNGEIKLSVEELNKLVNYLLGAGAFIKSPNGTRFKLAVDNSGNLSTVIVN